MAVIAEFEREHTAERTREATVARTERGLWDGGRLLGYDLDPERKGYLTPNATMLSDTASCSQQQVGGIAELPDVATTVLETPESSGNGTGRPRWHRGCDHGGRHSPGRRSREIGNYVVQRGQSMMAGRDDRTPCH